MTKIKSSQLDFGTEELDAAVEFLLRKHRYKNPPGTFDKAGRFYSSESCGCCSGIRSPSRSWPMSEMVHARTAVHVANLFDADETEAKRAARIIEKMLGEKISEATIKDVKPELIALRAALKIQESIATTAKKSKVKLKEVSTVERVAQIDVL